jgi:hypothetical protein
VIKNTSIKDFKIEARNKKFSVSEEFKSKKEPSGDFRKLLQGSINKANRRRKKLTREETTKLAKLEAIADKLRRGGNMQNRQLQTWLSEDEYAQIEAKWDVQK